MYCPWPIQKHESLRNMTQPRSHEHLGSASPSPNLASTAAATGQHPRRLPPLPSDQLATSLCIAVEDRRVRSTNFGLRGLQPIPVQHCRALIGRRPSNLRQATRLHQALLQTPFSPPHDQFHTCHVVNRPTTPKSSCTRQKLQTFDNCPGQFSPTCRFTGRRARDPCRRRRVDGWQRPVSTRVQA